MEKTVKKSGKEKLFCFVLIVILIVILNHIFGWSSWLSDMNNLKQLKQIVEENLIWAFLLYTLITIVACVALALPGITFAIFAGMLFGPVLGTFACLFACTIGASIAFLVGRFFLKDAIAPMLEKNPLLKRLLFSGNRKNDVIVLMITRLVPLFPYNLQNFAYGITDMSFWSYTAYTFLFMLPGVALYVIGAAGLTAEGNRWMYFLTAALIAVAVSFLGMMIKRKYLPEAEEEKDAPEQAKADTKTASGHRNAYIIMTRVPQAGKTKTRLLSVLTPEECKNLHEAFLHDLSDNLHPQGTDIFIS